MELEEKTDLDFLEILKGNKNIIQLECYYISSFSTATKCDD